MTLERKSFDLLLRAKPTPVPLELGGRGTISPPDLADSLNTISTIGSDYAFYITIGPLGLSDLPTALHANMQQAVAT